MLTPPPPTPPHTATQARNSLHLLAVFIRSFSTKKVFLIVDSKFRRRVNIILSALIKLLLRSPTQLKTSLNKTGFNFLKIVAISNVCFRCKPSFACRFLICHARISQMIYNTIQRKYLQYPA